MTRRQFTKTAIAASLAGGSASAAANPPRDFFYKPIGAWTAGFISL